MGELIGLINLIPTTAYRSILWAVLLWVLFQPKVGFIWYFAPSAIAQRRKERADEVTEQRSHERRREDQFGQLLRDVTAAMVNSTNAANNSTAAVEKVTTTLQTLDSHITQQFHETNERLVRLEQQATRRERIRQQESGGA